MTLSISKLSHRLATLAGIALLVTAMGGTWTRSASAAPAVAPQATTKVAASAAHSIDDDAPARRPSHKQVAGKLNLNTATEDQLMLLPTVGPSKAERVVTWRKKNGSFKRTADLRRVKGFGYKTFKKLEPFLDIQGETTLVAK
jgi:competence ComEA-like helix-hairpin-helix protein